MGAEVESKCYIPFAMRDLNADANDSWSPYFEENAVRGNPYGGGFMMQTVDGQAEFDREMLKRTILEHEAVFRKQVFELHRVYRIQKDLTRDFLRRELNQYTPAADVSGTNSFASRMQEEPPAWWLNGKLPVVGIDEGKHSGGFCREGSVHSSPGGLLLMHEHPQRHNATDDIPVVNLSTESESAETAEKVEEDGGELSVNAFEFLPVKHSNMQLPSSARLSLGSERGSKPREGGEESVLFSREQLLADLNEPVDLTCKNGFVVSANDDLQILRHRSDSFWWQEAPMLPPYVVEGASSSYKDNNGRMKRRNSIHEDDAHVKLFVSGYHGTGHPMSVETISTRLKQSGEVHRHDRSNAVGWYTKGPADGSEVPGRSQFHCSGQFALPLHSYPFPGVNCPSPILSVLAPSINLGCGSSDRKPNGAAVQRPIGGNSFRGKFVPELLPVTPKQNSHMSVKQCNEKPVSGAVCQEGFDLNQPLPNCSGDDLFVLGGNENCLNPVMGGLSWTSGGAMSRREAGFVHRNLSDSASTSRRKLCDQSSERNCDNQAPCFRSANLSKEEDPDDGVCGEALKDSKPAPRFVIDLNVELPDDDSTPDPPILFDLNAEQASEPADGLEFMAAAAANNIVAMSASVGFQADETDVSETLGLLAELAVSGGAATEVLAEVAVDDEDESFEDMVLKLEENKDNQYCCPEKGSDGGSGGDYCGTDACLLLRSKPRRGLGRRRRARKRDFQKDVLPGLVLLSRNEIVEDIQMLSVMMEALGEPWLAGAAVAGKRTGGGRAKRRQKITTQAIQVPESVSPAQACDLESDGINMMGWGRTTRRCRRLRCPSNAGGSARNPVPTA